MVVRGEEQGFEKRGRGREKVLLKSKCDTVKKNHMGQRKISVTMRIYKPRIHSEEQHDRTLAVACLPLCALLHHKEGTCILRRLARCVKYSLVIEHQQEEEGLGWWAMR